MQWYKVKKKTPHTGYTLTGIQHLQHYCLKDGFELNVLCLFLYTVVDHVLYRLTDTWFGLLRFCNLLLRVFSGASPRLFRRDKLEDKTKLLASAVLASSSCSSPFRFISLNFPQPPDGVSACCCPVATPLYQCIASSISVTCDQRCSLRCVPEPG